MSRSPSSAAAFPEPLDTAARDREWIRRIRLGDEAAFESMFRAYYEPMARFAMRFLGDERDAAKDLVHDVLFRVWQMRERMDVHGSLQTYLVGATRNRCIDYLRRTLTEASWQQRVSAEPIAGRIAPSPDTIAEEHEVDAAIARAIARLPARCRQTFLLHWQRGLATDEIAAAMGTSPNTVRVQIARALKSLRLALLPFLLVLIALKILT